ncbi:uncharacterized protein LOC141910126 [Tubulanus polymorphus]|uniref:uncharacterized protein LOC141910126 n=1 Tax=Tubulanus polymorphus TaxID=672921 RepID=UPI003DA1FF9B
MSRLLALVLACGLLVHAHAVVAGIQHSMDEANGISKRTAEFAEEKRDNQDRKLDLEKTQEGVETDDDLALDADKRACRLYGQSCTGTIYGMCCGRLVCHKPYAGRYGRCALCKAANLVCRGDSECCANLRCQKQYDSRFGSCASCKVANSMCWKDSECCGNLQCNKQYAGRFGRCARCKAANSMCQGNGECCRGYTCRWNRCRRSTSFSSESS